MAVTLVTIASPAAETLYNNTALAATGSAVKASSALLLYAIIDNTANAGAASYVKLYNLGSGSVVVGTTTPDEVIYVPQGVVIEHIFYTAAAPGKTFGTALTAACLTTGGTGGITGPSSSVVVTLAFV